MLIRIKINISICTEISTCYYISLSILVSAFKRTTKKNTSHVQQIFRNLRQNFALRDLYEKTKKERKKPLTKQQNAFGLHISYR